LCEIRGEGEIHGLNFTIPRDGGKHKEMKTQFMIIKFQKRVCEKIQMEQAGKAKWAVP
jgi:hypothetical protein